MLSVGDRVICSGHPGEIIEIRNGQYKVRHDDPKMGVHWQVERRVEALKEEPKEIGIESTNEPIVGYRGWSIRDGRLASPRFIWSPGENVAECQAEEYGMLLNPPKHSPEETPYVTCSCGIYAYNQPKGVYGMVQGTVALSGVVHFTKSGYRAQRARITGIYAASIEDALLAHIYDVPLLERTDNVF